MSFISFFYYFPLSLCPCFPISPFHSPFLNSTLLPPIPISRTREPIVGKPLSTPNPCSPLFSFHSFHREQVFPPADLVYLSPDAPDPLLSIDPSKVYVIGGFIDRSVNKVCRCLYPNHTHRIKAQCELLNWEFRRFVCQSKNSMRNAHIPVHVLIMLLISSFKCEYSGRNPHFLP